MAGRTTPKKARPPKAATYNQVDKDQITRSLLGNRLGETIATAIDAALGYKVQMDPEGRMVPVLVEPNEDEAETFEKRAKAIEAMLRSVKGTPNTDALRANHLVRREADLEAEMAHWSTMAEFPDAFDEDPGMVQQAIDRLGTALRAVRAAKAELPDVLEDEDEDEPLGDGGQAEADEAEQAERDRAKMATDAAKVYEDVDELVAEGEITAAQVEAERKAAAAEAEALVAEIEATRNPGKPEEEPRDLGDDLENLEALRAETAALQEKAEQETQKDFPKRDEKALKGEK